MYAPVIDGNLDFLAHRYRHQNECAIPFDDKSLKNIDEIFMLMKQIKPIRDDNDVHELWITADRGPIEAFGDYDELLEEGEVESKSEFEELWNTYYPNDTVWYALCTVEREDSGYRAIFLNHELVIEVDPRKKDFTFEEDISELTGWILEQIKRSLSELHAGTYNERINSSLPFNHRTGTIVRKDFWDIFPQCRTDFFENITQDEINAFVSLVNEHPSDNSERIPHLTANDFFKLCALGYKANNYSDTDLSAKEQYYRHADGRDDGLGEIDASSEEEFIKWLHLKDKYGHPWEVCRGGDSTHISLYVRHYDDGFKLVLSGSALTRTIETVKFYLAIRKAGYPVSLVDGHTLVSRLLEIERIGIVPEGVFPCYCESLFPNDHIIDFMNLPIENRQLIANHCVWQEIEPLELIDKSPM